MDSVIIVLRPHYDIILDERSRERLSALLMSLLEVSDVTFAVFAMECNWVVQAVYALLLRLWCTRSVQTEIHHP